MKLTIQDIAKKAEVSKMTVSRVLSGKGHVKKETAERIQNIIRELNYEPNFIARSLSSKQSMILGVIIFKTPTSIIDEYVAQVFSGIVDNSEIQQYRIMVLPVDRDGGDENEYLKIARTNMLDGLIFIRSRINDPKLDALAKSGFPFVLVNFKKFSPHYNFVDTENYKGAVLAMEHLINRGYKKIVFLSGNLFETNARDRFKAYQDTLKKYDLEYNEGWVVPTEFDEDDAYLKTEQLLKCDHRPTAIFAASDYIAIGAMRRIREMGLTIPNDIAIIGFDDIELASHIQPKLTTVRQPLHELGQNAGQILLDIITGKRKGPVHKMLKTTLIERESC
ncbi:MAG: LacI family DNA-binding transcriptional regulator [Calditrichaceae bacterium]